MKPDIFLYFHYPFCLKKCHYCDFTSMAGSACENLDIAYLKTIDSHKDLLDSHKIKTVFWGGGTPSLIDIHLLEKITSKLDISNCEEFSIEVNPATIDENKIKAFKDIGINRVSIGIQALNDNDLKVMGRIHNKKQALETIDLIKKYFDNISLDFIYGRPNQSAKDWEAELDEILALDVPHLSMYQLTIENDWQVELPSDDECEKMFDIAHTKTKNYNHYEISNYAKPGYECLHNLAYWRYEDYLGIGPSAHSRISGKALIYDCDIKNWLNNQNLTSENLALKDIFTERLLMGLRTKEGLLLSDTDYDFIDKQSLSSFIDEGLLAHNNNRLQPTFSGMKLNNYIIQKLLKADLS